MDFLARGAMAIFRVQGLLPTQLISNLAAVTAPLIPHVEIRVVVVDLVRGTEFPLVQLSFSAALVAILAISGIGFDIVAHFAQGGVELGL